MDLLPWISALRLTAIVDIAIMSVLIYAVLVWLARTRRATSILAGILIVAAIYLLARWFELRLTAAVLQGFFAVFLLALLIIFQEELRFGFERIAQWGLAGRFGLARSKVTGAGRGNVPVLVRTLTDLARDRVGALVVVRGRDLLVRHVEGGEELGGMLSEALLKSIFDSHSIGHDGAVVIEESRVQRFGCQLPLARRRGRPQLRWGTRHSAAVGLSELTDALCLVVSEERGAISVARHGELRVSEGADDLATTIEAFYDEIAPPRERRPVRGFLRRNRREKLAACLLAVALWFVLVYGAETVHASYVVPVEFAAPPPPTVTEVTPRNVRVTLAGPRRVFLFLQPGRIKFFTDLQSAATGTTTFPISASELSFPEVLTLERVQPDELTVRVEHAGPSQD